MTSINPLWSNNFNRRLMPVNLPFAWNQSINGVIILTYLNLSDNKPLKRKGLLQELDRLILFDKCKSCGAEYSLASHYVNGIRQTTPTECFLIRRPKWSLLKVFFFVINIHITSEEKGSAKVFWKLLRHKYGEYPTNYTNWNWNIIDSSVGMLLSVYVRLHF